LKLKILFILALLTLSVADTLTYFYDGANRLTIEPTHLGFENHFGLFTGENLTDLESLIPRDSIDPRPTSITGTAVAGSELFDPLLNKYEGTNMVNSDHVSELTGEIHLPKISTDLNGFYRYEDRFSQMFDRYASRYQIEQNKPLKNSAFGLTEEIGGGAQFRGKQVRGAVSARSFGRWESIPSTDSAYAYQTGKQVRGVGEFTHNRLLIRTGVGQITFSDLRYFQNKIDTTNNRRTSVPLWTDTTAWEMDFLGSYQFTKRSTVGIGMRSGIQLYENARLFVRYSQELPRIRWDISVDKIRENRGFGGSMNGSVQLNRMFSLSGTFTGVSELTGDYRWFESDTGFVSVYSSPIQELRESIAVKWISSSQTVPATVQVLLLGDQNPLYEQVFQKDSWTAVNIFSPVDKSILATGVTATASFSRPFVGITIDGMARMDILDRPALSTPGFLRTSVRVGKSSPRSLNGTVTLEQRAPVTQTRLDSVGNSIRRSTEWNHGVSASVRAPIVSPFLRDRIEPTLTISAGPFGMTKSAIVHLPGANPISPMISLAVEGTIRIGNE